MDLSLVFEVAKTITSRFDVVLHKPDDLKNLRNRDLCGAIWADLTSQKPAGPGNTLDRIKAKCGTITIYENSIQESLHILFTRFQSRHYTEGMFLLIAEYGEDWFTPILQHPHVVLRHPGEWRRKTATVSNQGAHETYVLFYLGPNVSEFCNAFYPIGLIPGINCWSAMITSDPAKLANQNQQPESSHPVRRLSLPQLNQSPELMAKANFEVEFPF